MKDEITSKTEKEIQKKTLLSFGIFLTMLAIAALLFYSLYNQKRTAENLQPALRNSLTANEWLFSHLFSVNKKTKIFATKDAVNNPRVNGNAGMKGILDTATWRLKIVKKPGDTLILHYSDILSLPKTDVIFDFKCVEGWSEVTHWGGVKFSDLIDKYQLTALCANAYVGMLTPDEKYYVGIDLPSMLQPQTILCYEMNGKPLPQNQGYPLRLIIPVKYGIKHIKRLSILYFCNAKPKDYWAEQGYDYYAGL